MIKNASHALFVDKVNMVQTATTLVWVSALMAVRRNQEFVMNVKMASMEHFVQRIVPPVAMASATDLVIALTVNKIGSIGNA